VNYLSCSKSTPDYLPNLEEKSGPATNEETHKAYHASMTRLFFQIIILKSRLKGIS
jgi:hypothetical protein